MKRNAPPMTEQEVLAWLDEHTFYSLMDKPTPDNLLYFARTRGGANLVDIQERRYRLTHDGSCYALQCLD